MYQDKEDIVSAFLLEPAFEFITNAAQGAVKKRLQLLFKSESRACFDN